MSRSENDSICLQHIQYMNRMNEMETGEKFKNYTPLLSACLAFINNNNLSRIEKARFVRCMIINIIRLLFDLMDPSQQRFLETFHKKYQQVFPQIMEILKDEDLNGQLLVEKKTVDMWFINNIV